jgi:hypothetical protein
VSDEAGWPKELRSRTDVADVVGEMEEFVRSLETRLAIYVRTTKRLMGSVMKEKDIIGDLQTVILEASSEMKPETLSAITDMIGRWVEQADHQAGIMQDATESMRAEDARLANWKKARRGSENA